jgi:hypothetical protein
MTFGICCAIRCELRFIFMEKENIFFKEWRECRSREWKTGILYDVLYFLANEHFFKIENC